MACGGQSVSLSTRFLGYSICNFFPAPWFTLLQRVCPSCSYATENTVKILVGNKSEKDSDRAVATDDARVSAIWRGLANMFGTCICFTCKCLTQNSARRKCGFSQRKAEDLGVSFIETSAKEAINVDLVRRQLSGSDPSAQSRIYRSCLLSHLQELSVRGFSRLYPLCAFLKQFLLSVLLECSGLHHRRQGAHSAQVCITRVLQNLKTV